MDYKTFKDMDLSRDEVERLANAMKDEQFKKLFFDYVDELQDPENVKIYQNEITQLEKERGVDVTFINPAPGYVIKTSVGGEKKCFLNVCTNENVKKPSSSVAEREGARGLQWSLPHTLSPVREDVDKKGVRCDVYDVVFHPDTLHLAQNNKAFRDMLNSTACDAVESNFDVTLDKKNLKFPKMQYKGAPHASVIRKPSQEGPLKREPGEQAMFDRIYAAAASASGKEEKTKSNKAKKAKKEECYGNYTRPNFVIKHRDCVDIQDFREARDAKINAAIPKELVVEVDLPLLKSSSDMTLDVTEKTVHLLSEKPAKYKLEITLPYEVIQDAGNAKFDKDRKKLVIVLPVKRREHFLEDSGVESDHGSSISMSPEERAPISEGSETQICEMKSEFRTSTGAFLDENLEYTLPDFTCHVFENNIAFTLNVKNVAESSIEKSCDEGVHVKFASVGSSFFPTYYAFYVKLCGHSVDVEKVSVEAWDNNVVLQFPFLPADKIVTSYLVGRDANDVTEKIVEEPHILNAVLQEEATAETKETKQETKPIYVENQQETKAIDIVSHYSESSGDELSCSYSPSKGRGILKRLGKRNVSRSISESSLDDIIVASSFENCHNSLDSVIPEDGEASTSLKKTVRFNDHVSKQLYRSNSSILGQKRKNQRKKSNKKRAQERRCSESEASEAEDKKERDDEEGETEETVVVKQSEAKKEEFSSDVFELDF